MHCPKCHNELKKHEVLIKGHLIKPAIFKQTLSCPVCSWKKSYRIERKWKTQERTEWKE